MSEWTYQGIEWEPNPDEPYESFVYLITNLDTGWTYVGKKQFYFTRTLPPLKGQKKKRKVKKESDWKTYYGSNDILLKDVSESSPDRFKREILHLCTSNALASYLEAKEQFVREVLEVDNSYNGWIMVRSRRNHLPQNQVPKPVKVPRVKKEKKVA